jgi:hypothetical protein
MDSSEPHAPDREDPAGGSAELTRQGVDSRRRFLTRAGLGGLVVTIGSVVVPVDQLLSPAYGQTATSTPPPTDAAVAAFAQSIELALVQAYDYALATRKVTTASFITALTAFGSHHNDHAGALASFAGTGAGLVNSKLLPVISGQFKAANNQAAVMQVAYDVENAMTATYLSFLAELHGSAVVQLAASILPVESQHATEAGLLLDLDPTSVADYLPSFITQDAAILPKLYPTPTA